MTEVEATVESEHVPEPKFEEFIVQWLSEDDSGAQPHRTRESALEDATDCRRDGYDARILRVSPPVERRVEIDWEAVNDEMGWRVIQSLMGVIQRYARIVEEPKQ